jgi:hypothetical protein
MDDRRANIDFVFMNGLKDFEVLPPEEVWVNIKPVIRKRRAAFVLTRIAAFIAVVVSLGFLAYWWNMEVSSRIDRTVIALNRQSSLPETNPDLNKPVTGTGKGQEKINVSSKPEFIAEPSQDKIIPVSDYNSPGIASISEIYNFPADKKGSVFQQLLIPGNSSHRRTFTIEELSMQYLPKDMAESSPGKWSIAAMVSPSFYSKYSSGSDDLSKQLMASEEPVLSYSGGLALSYKISKRFSIQSGLFYSSMGQVVTGINSFSGFQKYDYNKGDHNFEVLTTNGIVYTSNADVFLHADITSERVVTNYTSDIFDPQKASLQYVNNTMHQNFSYLELPVTLRYKIVDRTLDLNLIGGMSYNLLVNNSVYTVMNGSRYPIGETKGLNLLTLSSSLGMGMEYSFTRNLSMNLEPTFRYYLNPFNQNTGYKIHPYSIGIFSGISYRF